MAFRRDTPRYQRAMQQLQALSPEVQAVLNVRALDPVLQEEASNRLAFTKLAADKAYQEKSLDIAKERTDLSKKEQKWGKKMDLTSNVLAGLGVPIAGYSGYLSMKERQRIARLYENALARR